MDKFTKEYKHRLFNDMYERLKEQTKKNQKLIKKIALLRRQSNKKSNNNVNTERTIDNYFDRQDKDNQYLASLIHLLTLFSTGLNSKPMLKELHRCIEEVLLEHNVYTWENKYHTPIYNIWNYAIKLGIHTQLLEPRYISKRLPNLFKMLQKRSETDISTTGFYDSFLSPTSGVDTEITYNFLDHTNRYISNALQQYIIDRKHNVPAEVVAWKTKQLYIYMTSKLDHANAEISSMLYDSVKYVYKHPNQHTSRTHCNSINRIYEISKKYEKSYMEQYTYYSLIRRAEKACDSKRDAERLDTKLRNRLNKRLLNTKLYK